MTLPNLIEEGEGNKKICEFLILTLYHKEFTESLKNLVAESIEAYPRLF